MRGKYTERRNGVDRTEIRTNEQKNVGEDAGRNSKGGDMRKAKV